MIEQRIRDATSEVRREFLWRVAKWALRDEDLAWYDRRSRELVRIPIHPILPDLQSHRSRRASFIRDAY
jgi:hypothetical protein